ncbi:MAG: glycosyltransferase [Candidatus Nanoarchaeia archaeon]
MRKTLFLITGLGQGGAEKFLTNVLPHLDTNKILVVSITGVDDRGPELESHGIRVKYLNTGKKFNPLRSIYRFYKIVKKFKPDVLFTLLIHADIFGRIVGRLFGVHTIYCSIRNDYSKISKLWLIDKYSRWLVTRYIPNSKGLREYMEKIRVFEYLILPNGVNLKEIDKKSATHYSIREELNISSQEFVVCCNARLEKQKNHFALLEAFCNVEGHLILLNDGAYRREIEMKIDELNLSKRVHVLGKRDDVISILQESDVFVLASFTEGMSNALLEAMAMSLPCVVSDIEQNNVLIKDENMRFKTSHELREKLLKLYEHPSLREKVGRENRKIIENEFDIQVIAKQLRKILK